MKFNLDEINKYVEEGLDTDTIALEDIKQHLDEDGKNLTCYAQVGARKFSMKAKLDDKELKVSSKITYSPDTVLSLPEFIVENTDNVYREEELEYLSDIISSEILDGVANVKKNNEALLWGITNEGTSEKHMNEIYGFMSDTGYLLTNLLYRYRSVEKLNTLYLVFKDDTVLLRYQKQNGELLETDGRFVTKQDICRIVSDFFENVEVDPKRLFKDFIDPNNVAMDVTNPDEGEVCCLLVAEGLKTSKATFKYFPGKSIGVETESTLDCEFGKYRTHMTGQVESLRDGDNKLVRSLRLLELLYRSTIDGNFFREQDLRKEYKTLYKALHKIAKALPGEDITEVKEIYPNWPKDTEKAYEVVIDGTARIVATAFKDYYEIEFYLSTYKGNDFIYHRQVETAALDAVLTSTRNFFDREAVKEYLKDNKALLTVGDAFLFSSTQKDEPNLVIGLRCNRQTVTAEIRSISDNPLTYKFTTVCRQDETFLDMLKRIVEDEGVKRFRSKIEELNNEIGNVNAN